MQTPIEMRQSAFCDGLVNICTGIKGMRYHGENPTTKESDNLKSCLNTIFEEYECAGVIFTNNTDNILFGINVNPTINDSDLLKIVLDTESIELSRYNIEIDLRLCDLIESDELAAYIVEDVASTMAGSTIDNTRALLDTILATTNESIEIKQSINYSQILAFGIKDTIRKISSLIYKDEYAIGMNKFSECFGIKETLVTTAKIIKSNIFSEEDITVQPKLGILQWSLMVYTDIDINYKMAEDNLVTARDLTGSVLDKREVDRTLKCLRRASNEVLGESAILEESVKGFSLFRSLKQNGLRSIEDDLYEFKIRLKNCEVEDEALYILRQINTRISILEDYIQNTTISEAETSRWENVIEAYRDLRAELSKKKIGNKKVYGIFVDYDKLDTLDR